MDITLDYSIAADYKSPSQIARTVTEKWLEEHMYCPGCGNDELTHFKNNSEVADFYCKNCMREYELKSTKGRFGKKVACGAYTAMVKRISSNNSPNFFFMEYSATEQKVKNLIVVPRMLFTPRMVKKRRTLEAPAKRAGWTGSDLCLDEIPEQGRIRIVSERGAISKEEVRRAFNSAESLSIRNAEARGWLLDVLRCTNQIHETEFSLSAIYQFEEGLRKKHPRNKNVQAKIRQQLQLLRDKGFIEFCGNGRYRKINETIKA